ncbi:trifunctional purine biosynthetic protein adenosine-3-like [Gouania willdenowi]|uniref:trifunctional purine biosynthetic protein adenosine-3-like n=1 Tax=Gouania willdenowi TaxID=441366 RepID=UPI001054A512|nr:trifunctional purine biosynthetic protein adenosine-3-like isoform X1 [Gouania willdenowi]XP_028327983.1 trifunctional purine biosynthetic protein adenosine-3-like [Gouania willdenowi]
MAAPALMDQTSSSSSSAEIVLVVSNRPGVQGLKRASLAGIQTRVVDHKLYGGRAEFDATIDRVQEEFKAELVCLAGFMRILTKCNGKYLQTHTQIEKFNTLPILSKTKFPILINIDIYIDSLPQTLL